MGGQERRVLAESLGMRERGHDVWIATPPGGALADRAAEAGLEVIPMSFRRPLLPANALALGSWTRRLRPDVVNSHSSADSWTAALARDLGPRAGALVRSRHISVRVNPSPRHRFLYGQADYVITTGESVRQGLAGSGLVPLERSMSIPTGVDLERFRPGSADRAEVRRALGVSGEGPVIGVVAYLREDKGHVVLLDAVARGSARQSSGVLQVDPGVAPSGVHSDVVLREPSAGRPLPLKHIHGLVQFGGDLLGGLDPLGHLLVVLPDEMRRKAAWVQYVSIRPIHIRGEHSSHKTSAESPRIRIEFWAVAMQNDEPCSRWID